MFICSCDNCNYFCVNSCNTMTPQQKREALKARVTVDLKGSIKAKFFDEVLRTNVKESELARQIIEAHYGKDVKPERF